MAYPKIIIVKESISDLKKALKGASSLIIPRLRMLIEIKKNYQSVGISKRELADIIGVNHNSIQTWRSLYVKGGINLLTSYIKKEGRAKILSSEEHLKIKQLLNNPTNGINGYTELLNWVETELKVNIKYNTLLKYAMREFGSSIKVGRKSHIKKDEKRVEDFKKTLVRSVKKPLKNTKDLKP